MMATLRFVADFGWPPEAAFAFLGNVHNLDRVTPPWFRLRPMSPEPVALAQGARVDYRLRWRGVPLRWQSVIRVWRPPWEIAYEQARGPFRRFRHEHRLTPRGELTRLEETIELEVWGGSLVRRYIVEPDLHRIFRFREQRIRELFARRPAEPRLPPAAP